MHGDIRRGGFLFLRVVMVSKNLWKQNHVLEYSNKETPVSGSNKKLHILKSSAYPQARGGVQ